MTRTQHIEKEQFSMGGKDWIYSTIYLLALAMFGLHFPLGYLFLPLILVSSLVRNRYDFIIQLFLFAGGYGFMYTDSYLLRPVDVMLLISVVCYILVLKRTDELRQTSKALLAYLAILVLFALASDESLSIQIRMMRRYIIIIAIFVPVAFFAAREFDIQYFFRRIIGYCLVLCCFYIIDCYLLDGFLFVPGLKKWGIESDYDYTTLILHPLSFEFGRKYPQGLYLMALAVFPLARYYKLKPMQWVIIALAIISTRTMTFTAGLIITYIIFIGKFRQLMIYAGCAIVLVTGVYFLDRATGGNLRVQSTVDQFTALDLARDEEDLSEFGSGRMAQILPKMAVLIDDHKVLTGFGFLHPELTTNPKYIIVNKLYIDSSKAEEVVTGVEVTQVQTVLDIGVIGLILQTAFYLLLYFIIRRIPYASYYLSVLLCISLFGIGGFAGLCQSDGVLLTALAYATILLVKLHGPVSTTQSSNT